MSKLPKTTTYNGQIVPIYWGTTKAGNTKKPTLSSGKLISALILMTMFATPVVALMQQSQKQQLLITQPSISAISETVKK
jgi:hypothetical protein